MRREFWAPLHRYPSPGLRAQRCGGSAALATRRSPPPAQRAASAGLRPPTHRSHSWGTELPAPETDTAAAALHRPREKTQNRLPRREAEGETRRATRRAGSPRPTAARNPAPSFGGAVVGGSIPARPPHVWPGLRAPLGWCAHSVARRERSCPLPALPLLTHQVCGRGDGQQNGCTYVKKECNRPKFSLKRPTFSRKKCWPVMPSPSDSSLPSLHQLSCCFQSIK